MEGEDPRRARDTGRVKYVVGPDGVRHQVTPAVERWLASLSKKALTNLALELASYSPEAMRSLQLRAAPADSQAARHLVAAVDAALASVNFDYHDDFDWDDQEGVQNVEDVVDELERHLDTGAHEVVRQVAQHLLVRLAAVAEDADNADILCVVAERACALFGRAVAGHPDPVSLARWVVRFRAACGGWPPLHLDAVAHAFDEPAWAAYRADVAALGGGGPGADPYRDEADCMLLELADHDADVDQAVALLTAGQKLYYGEVVTRLRAARRGAELLAWLDRAVADNCVDDAWRGEHTVVPAEDATQDYLDGGRPDSAIAIARTLFDRDLTVGAYRLLREVAERCGLLDEQRTWAFAQATRQAAKLGGAPLIRLHLADEDVASAWQAADAYGAGPAWRELVGASESDFPLQAGRMCMAQAKSALVTPESKRYPSVVDLLVKARSMYERAGLPREADAEIIGLREAYRRRPALMAAMNGARLPS